ncbi:MAG: hypothetical protein AAF414_17155 [Pseudomonadota bacterium]
MRHSKAIIVIVALVIGLAPQRPSFAQPPISEILYASPCSQHFTRHPGRESLTNLLIITISSAFLAANLEEDVARSYLFDDPQAMIHVAQVCQSSDRSLFDILTMTRVNLPSNLF